VFPDVEFKVKRDDPTAQIGLMYIWVRDLRDLDMNDTSNCPKRGCLAPNLAALASVGLGHTRRVFTVRKNVRK
jgi:hypothetical protein